MAEIRRITPEEAKSLLEEGYVYVDVRSEPEFEAGHVPGAYNVPISRQGPGGLVPNPDFLDSMKAAFDIGERLVIGCRSGARSRRAAAALAGAGFTNVVELGAGWEGSRDAFGKLEPGWNKKGFSVELGAPEGRRYPDVKQRRA